MNSDSSEHPKPNPTSMALRLCWASITITVVPSRPNPTTNAPVVPPAMMATRKAAGIDEVRAAAAVRTLARTAVVIPISPASADSSAPTKKASMRYRPDSPKLSTVCPVRGSTTLVAVRNTRTARGTVTTAMVLNCRLR